MMAASMSPMSHVVSHPREPTAVMGGAATLHQVPVWRDNFSWILVCEQTGHAAVVDGPEADPVLDYCSRHQLKLDTILTTHTHPDHIGIHRELVATCHAALSHAARHHRGV